MVRCFPAPSLRRTSRLTVEGARPRAAAIRSRLCPAASMSATVPRSASERNRSEIVLVGVAPRAPRLPRYPELPADLGHCSAPGPPRSSRWGFRDESTREPPLARSVDGRRGEEHSRSAGITRGVLERPGRPTGRGSSPAVGRRFSSSGSSVPGEAVGDSWNVSSPLEQCRGVGAGAGRSNLGCALRGRQGRGGRRCVCSS